MRLKLFLVLALLIRWSCKASLLLFYCWLLFTTGDFCRVGLFGKQEIANRNRGAAVGPSLVSNIFSAVFENWMDKQLKSRLVQLVIVVRLDDYGRWILDRRLDGGY